MDTELKLLLVFIFSLSIFMILTNLGNKENECLKQIAEKYCKERGKINLENPKSNFNHEYTFFCVDNKRNTINQAYQFKFLETEILKCK
jgi:hypothetical protein